MLIRRIMRYMAVVCCGIGLNYAWGDTPMRTNLAGVPFEGKERLLLWAEHAYGAAKDAYGLSMPLLVAGMVGDMELFHGIWEKMRAPLEAMDDKSFQAWLYGRVLIAADNVGDRGMAVAIAEQLKKLLDRDDLPQNAMSTWAWGYWLTYQGRHNRVTQYEPYRLKVIEMTDAVIDTDHSKDRVTNVLWALVMDASAAASADDKRLYRALIRKAVIFTRKATADETRDEIPVSIVQAAFAEMPMEDFQPWGLASMAVFAAAVGQVDQAEAFIEAATYALGEPLERAQKKGEIDEGKAAAIQALTRVNIEWARHSLAIRRATAAAPATAPAAAEAPSAAALSMK